MKWSLHCEYVLMQAVVVKALLFKAKTLHSKLFPSWPYRCDCFLFNNQSTDNVRQCAPLIQGGSGLLSRLHTFTQRCGVWDRGISILIASLLMREESGVCFAWRVAGHRSLPGLLSTHTGSSICLISSGIFVACFLKCEMCDLN